jgi:hypothetical protein
MKVHLEPTDEFLLFCGAEVHVWKGETDTGEGVIALIADIITSGNVMATMPAPPSDHTWLDATAAAMSELWSIAGRLSPDQADGLVAIARGWIKDRERKLPDLAQTRQGCRSLSRATLVTRTNI